MARTIKRPPKKAARKTSPKGKRIKGGGFYMPTIKPDPDALFTMILSSHKFLSDNFKSADIGFNEKKLMRNLITAVENTLQGKKSEQAAPDYNLSADALAGAFLAHQAGDTRNSRRLAELAFESPDCEKLMDTLAAINTAAEGKIPEFISDMSDKEISEVPMDFSNNDMSAPQEDIEDITGGGTTDADENHDNENSQTEDKIISYVKNRNSKKSNSKKMLKSFRKMLSEDMQLSDDDGDMDDLQGVDPSSFALSLREKGKLVPIQDDFITDTPGTMRLNDPESPDNIEPAEPDGSLQQVSLLTAEELNEIRDNNPDLIAMANKISVMGGKSKKMASRLIEKVLYPE